MLTPQLLIIAFLFLGSNQKIIKSETPEYLFGSWKVVESTLVPFEHISYCKKLGLHSIFEFAKPNTIKVYQEHINDNCNGSQKFFIDSVALSVVEDDMAFQYEVLKLTPDSLIIKTNRVPDYFYIENRAQNAARMNSDTIQLIKTKGIIIKMVKIKSVS